MVYDELVALKKALSHCGYCRANNIAYLCGDCFATSYCSSRCQRLHWNTHQHICGHSEENASRKRKADPDMPEETIILDQQTLDRVANNDSPSFLMGVGARYVFRLPASLEDCRRFLSTHPIAPYLINIQFDTLEQYELLRVEFPQIFNQITHLVMGTNFNSPIREFPPNLTHLVFGWYYDQKTVLPPTLIYLDIGNKYSHRFASLPDTLQTLVMKNHQFLVLPSKKPDGLHIIKKRF